MNGNDICIHGRRKDIPPDPFFPSSGGCSWCYRHGDPSHPYTPPKSDRQKKFEEKVDMLTKNNKDVSISEIANHAPRMPWFGATCEPNYEDKAVNSGKRWTAEETAKLKKLWDEIGFGDEMIWKEIAEEFGRSLSSIEHQLRMFETEEIYRIILIARRRRNLGR